ncbi:MAG: hypothetical protein WD801_04065 [Gemmatimonadaceae bacterium]
MTRGTVESRLEELKREVRRELRPLTKRAKHTVMRARTLTWRTAALWALTLAAFITLPFIVYVRASVWLYLRAGFSPWTAVAGATCLTLGIAAVYAAWLSRAISGQARVARVARWVMLPLAVAWCGYAALYLSRVNTKSDEVRRYYGTVHPVLRVALATAILGDPGVVVTDMRRVPADYARMGLPELERTRHYRQSDGWVHAADLRTIGRGEFRNRALQLYFWSMGFRTLRHVGTADHLHVQLAPRS